MNVTEKTLIEALSYSRVRELPPVWNGQDEFSLAIMKVMKDDCNEYYVIGRYDNATSRISVFKDFGAISSVKSILSIHPYEYTGVAQHEVLKVEKMTDIDIIRNAGIEIPVLSGKKGKIKYIIDNNVPFEGNLSDMKTPQIDAAITSYLLAKAKEVLNNGNE